MKIILMYAICVTGGDVCSGIDSNWFPDLFYCGLDALGSVLLADCVASLSRAPNRGDPPPPSQSRTLLAYVQDTDACSETCITTFANAISGLLKNGYFNGHCSLSGTPIWTTNVLPHLYDTDCLAVMSGAIATMNSCMTVLGTVDIVTGGAVVPVDVCTGIDANWFPDLFYCALEATYSVSLSDCVTMFQIAPAKGSPANHPDKSLTLSAYVVGSDPCALTCVTAFTNAITALLEGGSFNGHCAITGTPVWSTDVLAHQYDQDCLAVMNSAIWTMDSCMTALGNIDIVTASTLPSECPQLTEMDFYPYRAFVSCSGQSLSPIAFINCVSSLLHRTLWLGAACQPCYDTLSSDVASIDTSVCQTNVFTTDCIDLFSAAFVNFETCSGATVDLSDSLCSVDEWTNLTYQLRSMVPMYLAGRYATSIADALSLINASAELTNLKSAVADITCKPCFDIFVADVYTLYTSDAAIETVCGDPYTTECVSALANPMNAFTYCSDQDLNWSATSTTCTSGQFEALVNIGVANSVLAATLSPSVLSLTSSLDAIYTSFDNAGLRAPCWPCFTELARNVFNLDNADLATCQNITSAGCYAIIGNYLNGFQDCSGGLAYVTTPAAVTTSTPAVTSTVSTAYVTTASSASFSSFSDTTTLPSLTTSAPTTKTSAAGAAMSLFTVLLLTLIP